MKTKMSGELKGVLLTHALHQLIPQIETNKHYRVRIEEVDYDKLTMQGNDLGVLVGGQIAVSADELTYAEVWENQQRFDNKRERAYLEPLDRGDVAGNEVQPVTLALRETRAQEWLEGDDDEAQPYQAVKRAVVFEVE